MSPVIKGIPVYAYTSISLKKKSVYSNYNIIRGLNW